MSEKRLCCTCCGASFEAGADRPGAVVPCPACTAPVRVALLEEAGDGESGEDAVPLSEPSRRPDTLVFRVRRAERRPLPFWVYLGGVLLLCLCAVVILFGWVLRNRNDPVAFQEALQMAKNAEPPQVGLQQVELVLQERLTATQRAEAAMLRELLHKQVQLAEEVEVTRRAEEARRAEETRRVEEASRVEPARPVAVTPAAAPQDPQVMYAQGVRLARGEGVAKDEAEACKWLSKAALAGSRAAQHDLAALYAAGVGGVTNLALALDWARSAAQQGDAASQAWLGYCCASGLGGVPVDPVQALQWNEKASAQGDLLAQVNLAVQYANGHGVRLDSTRAAELFARAAARGLAEAQVNLGVMYLKGVGVALNPTNAVQWFRKAHEQGHVQGTYALGVSYLDGLGVAKDRQMAAACFLAAARKGHVGAQKQLGRLFLTGSGVACSEQDAFYWFGVAAAQGDQYARQAMDAYNALRRQASVRARCEMCAGQGAKERTCPDCRGAGTLSQTTISKSIRNCSCGWQMINGRCPNCGKSENLSRTVTAPCSACRGTGKVRVACNRCGGTGELQMAGPNQATLAQLLGQPDSGLALAVESVYLPVRLQPFRAGVGGALGL